MGLITETVVELIVSAVVGLANDVQVDVVMEREDSRMQDVGLIAVENMGSTTNR